MPRASELWRLDHFNCNYFSKIGKTAWKNAFNRLKKESEVPGGRRRPAAAPAKRSAKAKAMGPSRSGPNQKRPGDPPLISLDSDEDGEVEDDTGGNKAQRALQALGNQQEEEKEKTSGGSQRSRGETRAGGSRRVRLQQLRQSSRSLRRRRRDASSEDSDLSCEAPLKKKAAREPGECDADKACSTTDGPGGFVGVKWVGGRADDRDKDLDVLLTS